MQELNDMDIEALRETADSIPSLGVGKGIGSYLERYASKAPHCIVEIGAWMGSNSAHIQIGRLLGAHGAKHHVFDPFSAEGVNAEKAKKYHGIEFNHKDDLIDIYKRNMARFGLPVIIHRESAFEGTWMYGQIDLFVDDFGCDKYQMRKKIKRFYPYFIPGKTIIIMVDYYFYETHGGSRYQYQRQLVKKNPGIFNFIERAGKSKAAVFLYGNKNPLKNERMSSRITYGDFQPNQIRPPANCRSG